MDEQLKVTRNCPCCQKQAAQTLWNNQMATIGGIDMSYTVGCCQHCGLLYANELPQEISYIKYYKFLSKYDQIISQSQIPDVDRVRASAAIDLCRPYLSPESTIADLGCAIGFLLSQFQEAGWKNLYGLDPAPNAAVVARNLFGLTGVKTGMLSESIKLLPLDRIDLLCLTGVLEHLWAPHEELQLIFNRLKPGTFILIEVPAVERFSKQRSEPFGEFSLEHIQYFSERSLGNMFHELGAEIIKTTIISLDGFTTDSLFGLFRIKRTNNKNYVHKYKNTSNDAIQINSYIAQSNSALLCTLDYLKKTPSPWIIYGAGSHTSRLLPKLAEYGLDTRIAAIVDGNANLHGKTIGCWPISAPSTLKDNADAKIIISSFNSQEAIHSALSMHYSNQLIRLYPDQSSL